MTPFEIFAGAFVATLFLVSTPVVAFFFAGNGPELKNTLLLTYIIKISLLMLVGFALTSTSLDELVFGLSIVASGLVYLLVQTVVFVRSER